MIAYIKGKLTYKSPTELIVETNGIGYKVFITVNTYRQIGNNTDVQLMTHFLVKEDGHYLYGFFEAEELDMFEKLISVSGVGPSTARLMLSAMSAKEIRSAIIAENESADFDSLALDRFTPSRHSQGRGRYYQKTKVRQAGLQAYRRFTKMRQLFLRST